METGTPGPDPIAEEASDNDKLRAPSIVVVPDNAERKTATYKDKHLRLLLKTLSFHRLGANDDPDAAWIIPSELGAQSLTTSLGLIKKFEFDLPVYEEGKSAESDMTCVLVGGDCISS